MYAARSISVVIRGRALLDGVDLALEAGKVVAVVGPNGAGKTTLFRALTGERPVTGGRVELDGRPLSAWGPAALAARRAVLPQSVDVAFPFLAAEIVSLGCAGHLPGEARERLVRQALADVEMADHAARVYGTLSGGEQQRVQFARILVQVRSHGCDYLILDEPTASLDLAHQLLILRLARAHAQAGGAVAVILHDLNLASMAADRIVALKEGCCVAAGSPAEVIRDDLIATLYGVRMRVRGVPEGPFLLPQTVADAGGSRAEL